MHITHSDFFEIHLPCHRYTAPPQTPFLQPIINKIVLADSEESLTPLLVNFETPFHFERTEERNLLAWHRVLNRFDELLERYVNRRNIFDKSIATTAPTTPSPSSSSQVPRNDNNDNVKNNNNASSTPTPTRPSPLSVHTRQQATSQTPKETPKQPVPASEAPQNTTASSISSPPPFTPSPTLVHLILSVTLNLLANALDESRHFYNSTEYINALLADPNTGIVFSSLQIFHLLLYRYHKMRSSAWTHTLYDAMDRVAALSVGWGGRENSLGLLECCSSTPSYQLSSEGGRLVFEFEKEKVSSSTSNTSTTPSDVHTAATVPTASPAPSGDAPVRRVSSPLSTSPRSSAASSIPLAPSTTSSAVSSSADGINVSTTGNVTVIVIDDVGGFKGNERWLIDTFARQQGVPKTKLFSLLWAFRRARAFSKGRVARIEMAVIRLLALATVFHMQPLVHVQWDSHAKEPELIQDVLAIARADAADGLADAPCRLRLSAIRCIAALSNDRHRIGAIMSATGVHQHHGVLPSLLRTEMAAIGEMNDGGVEMDTSTLQGGEGSTSGRRDVEEGVDGEISSSDPLSLLSKKTEFPEQQLPLHSSLLNLVQSLSAVSGTAGATSLANSGVLSILIPLLSHHERSHLRFVTLAVRTMQAIIECCSQTIACQLFRDQDGLNLVVERMAHELQVEDTEEDPSAADEAAEVETLKKRGESRKLYEDLLLAQMTPSEALEHQPPSASMAARGQLLHSRWYMLRTLLQLLATALGSGGNEVRELVVHSRLSASMRKILGRPFTFGGSLFFAAAQVVTDISHAEPRATAELEKAGIAHAVLKSVKVGLPPCGEAVRCLPSLIAALCLAPSAKDIFVSSPPLKPYLLRLATPFYARSMHGDIPTQVGNALDELMRHVQALRLNGSEAMCVYLNMSATFVTETSKVTRSSSRQPSSSAKGGGGGEGEGIEGDKKGRSDSVHSSAASQPEASSSHANSVLLDKMKLAIANNSCRLVGFAQASTEHQEGIVAHGGLEDMIKLRLAPALACDEAISRDSQNTSRYYPTPAMSTTALVTALRSIANRHSTSVLKCVFKVICEDATAALRIAHSLNDCWLPEEDALDKDGDVVLAGNDSILTNDGKSGVLSTSRRKELRQQLDTTIRKLRLSVVILSGLTRGGPGTSSLGAWEAAGGGEVVSLLATVERATRCHLARVYTGLTLTSGNEADLSSARVTAAADPMLKSLRPEHVSRILGDTSKAVGCSIARSKRFEEICKSYEVPPETPSPARQTLKGFAWQMVTFAVAVQKLYGNLSRGVSHNSRRHGRDPATRHGVNAKSLAASIGRIFVLHLLAAPSLWNAKVLSMGKKRVVAAWDYVRGVLIEMRGALFEESRSGTMGLMLKSFLEAGGREALADAVRPCMMLRAASPFYPLSESSVTDEEGRSCQRSMAEVEELMKKESLTTCSAVLALSDFMREMNGRNASHMEARKSGGNESKNEDETSLDSVTNQARVLSRMVVGDAESGPEPKMSKQDVDLRKLLSDRKYLGQLKERIEGISASVLEQFGEYAVRRIAIDSWQTVWNVLFLMAACPGLSSPSSSPTEPSSSSEEWAVQDIRRSSLSVVLQLLGPVASMSRDVLSVYSSDGTALADMLGIVQYTSANFQELCRMPAGRDGNLSMEEMDDFLVQNEATPNRPVSPDPVLVQNLVEMGFPERRARRALRTTPGNLQHAAEWLLTSADADSSDGSDADREAGRMGEEDDQGDVDRGRSEAEGGNDEVLEDGPNDDNNNSGDGVVAQRNDNENDDEDGEGSAENAADGQDGGADAIEAVQNPSEISRRNRRSATDSVIGRDRRPSGLLQAAIAAASAQTDSSPPEGVLSPNWRGRENRMSGCGSSERPRPSRSPSARLIARLSEKKDERTVSTKPPLKQIDRDSSFLQFRCAHTELSLLRGGLERGDAKEKEFEFLRRTAATLFGYGEMTFENEDDESLKNYVVSPVSMDKFKQTKKDVFSSLANMTREVLNQAVSGNGASHLPYVGIELLSALHRDGSISEEDMKIIGSNLAEMLAMYLSCISGEDGSGVDSLTGQTVVLWSHFGGWKGRKGLTSCGAFQLALGLLQSIVDALDGGPNDIDEASDPIEKLHITEGGNEKANCTARKNRERPLRAATAEEVLKLRQITTCVLLLDAKVRFSLRDKIAKGAFEASERKEKEGEAKPDEIDGEKKVEKMDTDAAGDGEGEQNGVEVDIEGGSAKVEKDNEKETEKDVEMKVLDEEMLEKHRKEAERKRISLLAKTKKTVLEVMHISDNSLGGSTSDGDEEDIDEKQVLFATLRVLKMMRRIECGDAMLAVLQLLGSLTRNWSLTELAVKEGIVEVVLGLPQLESRRVRSVDSRSVRMLVRTIMRHVVEDKDTLLEGMKTEIREVASSSSRPPRSSRSLKSLIEATSPLAARDMMCYVTALHESLTASGHERTSVVEVVNVKAETRKDVEVKLKVRPNVKQVVEGLCGLVVIDDAVRKEGKRKHWSKEEEAFDLVWYALKTLAEIVEFSRVAAVAFINAPSPSGAVKGSALDYIVQKLLPLGMGATLEVDGYGGEGIGEMMEVSNQVERLFASLCTKSAGSHAEAVSAFARAVAIEADKEVASAGLVRGVAQCFVQGARSRVMRAVLKSDLGNDLARCLAKLDVVEDKRGTVCSSVLRALSLIGQAATHMARYGDHVGDDVAFGGRNANEHF